MSQLRHRIDNKATMTQKYVPGEKTGGLRYGAMIEASPQQTGQLLKLGVPALFLLLPTFVKQWVLKWRCLSMLRPTWKSRRLILLGGFLYKFGDSKDVGSPADLMGMEVSLVESTEAWRLGISECISILPESIRNSVFRVATFRKTYYFACQSREEALVWIRSLHDARHEAIRRSMGHADMGSYSKSWEYYDSLGKQATATKDRIRHRMESSNLRELEMSSFVDSGTLPRGYFG